MNGYIYIERATYNSSLICRLDNLTVKAPS